MNNDQLKAWRAKQKLSQSDLAKKLAVSKDSLSLYERGVQPVPKPVELALVALGLGVEEYDGGDISIFKVMSEHGVEWIENPIAGWRSRPQEPGVIAEWLGRNGYKMAADGTVITMRSGADVDFKLRWR